MTTNKTEVTWPLTAEGWAAVERAARKERARALAAFGHGIVGLVKRMFGSDGLTVIYVPHVRGRITG